MKAKHPRRTTSPPRELTKKFLLRPGQRLVTSGLILTARKRRRAQGGGGLSVTIKLTCSCSEGEPNKPDCKAKSTTVGDTTTVKCVKSGGCTKCPEKTVITGSGVFMA